MPRCEMSNQRERNSLGKQFSSITARDQLAEDCNRGSDMAGVLLIGATVYVINLPWA